MVRRLSLHLSYSSLIFISCTSFTLITCRTAEADRAGKNLASAAASRQQQGFSRDQMTTVPKG
jgi:hypothetical protein